MRIRNGVIILKKKVFLVILCMFILFLIIWGVNYYTYHKYIDSSFEHLPGTLGTFLTDSDNKYSYLVGKPALFEFSGCLSSNNENGTIGIVAWPRFMCNGIKEYGLILYKEDESDDDNNIGYLLYVNEDMSINDDKETGLLDSEHEAALSLYAAYYQEIMEQYRAMQSVFDLV